MTGRDRVVAASWGSRDGQTITGLTTEQLDALLDELETKAFDGSPFLVDLTDENGSVLTIGLGLAVTVLHFMDGSGDPPYWTSFVEDHVERDSIWFDYFDSESEFGPEQIVEKAVAREVVRSFAASGERSGVLWAEV